MALLNLKILAVTGCAALTFIGFSAPAMASSPGKPGEKYELQMHTEAALWLDTVFGYCMTEVAGHPLGEFKPDLSEGWTPVREDAETTLGLKLFNPMESPKTHFTIVDLSPSGTSCWTQHSTLAPKSAIENFNSVMDGEYAGQIELVKSGTDKTGSTIRFYEYTPDDGSGPITIYQARNTRPQLTNFVTIIKRGPVAR